MRKCFIPFLLLLCATQALAQNNPRTCLWQVHKPGTHHTSYLFGTFHEVDGSHFSSLPVAAQQLAQADLLFVERSSQDVQREESAQDYATWNASKWRALLTSPQRETFTRFVEKAEDSSYYQLSPLVLRLALFRLYEQNYCDTLNRTSGELLDSYIERMALARKTPVQSLDTREDTRKALLSDENRRAKVGHAAYCAELMQAMLQNDASKCGGTQEYKDMDWDYEFGQNGRNILGLLDRNANWMVTLDKALQEKNCFVAVGLRHLMYKQGLIQQLRSRGYTVTPVAAR